MKLFLLIEIGNWKERGYDRRWLHYASSLSDDLIGSDLDNQSDAHIADLVLRLIDQAEKVFVLIDVHDPGQPFGPPAKILHYLSERSERLAQLVVNSAHSTMLEFDFGGKLVFEDNEERIKRLIELFAQ